MDPMLATVGTAVPRGPDWVFEQKYDGMRVLATISTRAVHLVTRNGREKNAQFPEIVAALRGFARRVRRSLVLDGEIVAVAHGSAAPFQALQPRMQLQDAAAVAAQAAAHPAAFVAFDLLRDGRMTLLRAPWHARRARLEALLAMNDDSRIRISERSSSATRMIAKARRCGWEGVIAKRTDAFYVPGARSPDWRKLKLQHRAEFVVGGYTDPRRTRPYLGALILGYFDAHGRLCYVGHMGGGFNRASLRAMLETLQPLQRQTSPFADRVPSSEPAHWVKPTVVVEVKFAEWTSDGKLRQPIFLGVRDDKAPRDVHRERESIQEWTQEIGGDAAMATASKRKTAVAKRRTTRATPTSRRASTRRPVLSAVRGPTGAVIRQLDEIEARGDDGTVRFGRTASLHVTHLGKPFFPADGFTKGDVMRYYAAVSPMLLPVIAGRPLVLKRYPNGITGSSFFQQNAGAAVPDGVRTARVPMESGQRAERIIGGDLLTLLYLVQIGAIAVHAWQARVTSPRVADSATLDLDPGDDVPFRDVVTLARQIKGELDALQLRAAVKTSGSSGLHIVLPLPPNTSFDDAARVTDRIARRVVQKYPDLATLERSVQARPLGTIYVDAQQNAEGKTVVAAYSVRERSGATVSAPLDWRELRADLRLEAFTIATMPMRIRKVGDLWGAAMKRRNTQRAIDRVLDEE